MYTQDNNPLPVWIILSHAHHHISTNSQPFLVGIVSIGQPSTRDYIRYVENNLIPNCPITRRDIITAEHNFGPDVGVLKGKTTRRRPLGVGLYNHVPIPSAVVEQYPDVILAVDILYVNKLPFIATISRHIHFGTVEFLCNQKAIMLTEHIKQVNRLYRQ